MFCNKCGKQLPDHVAFCTACGTPVVKAAAPVVPAEPEVLETVAVPEAVMEEIPAVEPILEEIPVEAVAVVETPAEEIPVEAIPVEDIPVVASVSEAVTAEEIPAVEPVLEETLPELAEPLLQPESVVTEPPVTAPVYVMPEPPVVPAPSAMPESPVIPVPQPAPVPPVKREAPASKKVKTRKKRPHMALRALLQLLSFLLCLTLVVTLMAGVVLLDLRKLTSAEGLEPVIKALISGMESEKEEAAFVPVAPNGPVVMPMADININVDDIPTDILTGGNSEENMAALVDWVYEQIQENSKENIKFSSEDLQNFVESSTVSDFVSEKLAGFAEDFINGTETTEITADELMELLEDNEHALEQELNIVLSEKDKQKINDTLVEVVEEKKLNETIRDKVNTTMDETLKESVGVDLKTVQNLIRQATSDLVLYIVLGICLLLVLLLCALNYYNVGAGLSWSSAAGILDGVILSLPLLIIQYSAEMITNMVPEAKNVMGLLQTVIAPIAPYHYWLLIGSLVVFILSIVWRCVARSVNNKRPEAA